jgi:hypothetical protein
VLLDAGANPELRTRIDECETPLEMATSAGLSDIAAVLARKRRPDPASSLAERGPTSALADRVGTHGRRATRRQR